MIARSSFTVGTFLIVTAAAVALARTDAWAAPTSDIAQEVAMSAELMQQGKYSRAITRLEALADEGATDANLSFTSRIDFFKYKTDVQTCPYIKGLPHDV